MLICVSSMSVLLEVLGLMVSFTYSFIIQKLRRIWSFEKACTLLRCQNSDIKWSLPSSHMVLLYGSLPRHQGDL